MTTVVFLGPSLPLAEAATLLEADYRPPARMGDVYAALSRGARRIVLIDGVFHSTPSVWQREILDALRDGVEVHGASSMGALRAAELHRHGMRGHGRIFAWYRDGVVRGDDEVALLHGPAELDWRPLSVPLVNVRASLAGRAEHDAGLQAARDIPYAERTWDRLAACGIDIMPRDRVDQKALDAREILRLVARSPHPDERAASPPAPPQASCDPQPDLWQRERMMATRFAGDIDGRALYRAIEDDGERLEPYLHRRWFALAHPIDGTQTSYIEFRAEFLRRWNIEPTPAWLADNGLTPSAFDAWLVEEATVERATGQPGFLHASWHGDTPPLAESERENLHAWARTHGVDLEPEALIVHGPGWFGAGHHWHRAVELLRAMQASGLAARYAAAR